MRILILTLSILTLSLVTAQAQKRKPALAPQPCSLTVDQLPLVRGLRLGQPYEHLQEVLPRVFISDPGPDEYGVRRVSVQAYLLETPSLLENVSSLDLLYFDNTLRAIHIVYTANTRWQTNLHFVAAIAEQLKLPRQGWTGRDPSGLTCRGFDLGVSKGSYRPTLLIVDSTAFDAMDARKAEVEERKRTRFRP